MCISLADLRRGVVAEGLREVRLLGEDGLGGLGLGLGLGSALAVFLGLGVLLFLTLLCDPRPAATRRAEKERQVNAVHARPLAFLAVALAVEVSPLLLGRLLLGRLGGRDLRGSSREDVASMASLAKFVIYALARTSAPVIVSSAACEFGQSLSPRWVSSFAQASLVRRLEKSIARELYTINRATTDQCPWLRLERRACTGPLVRQSSKRGVPGEQARQSESKDT